MFHNVLAPTGLPSPSKVVRNQKLQQGQIEKTVINAINDIVATNQSRDSKIAYNIAHPDTIALIKSLDKFFAHGLIKMDRCYWSFTREFVPAEERFDLKAKWNCSNRRDLSLAWIKDSLNRGNLQFQMFGFIACDEELKKTHYERNACIRNMILLKRVCLLLDDIVEVQFKIEPPFVFRTEDTPIALPITQMDGTMSPIDSSNSSLNGIQIQFSPNLPMNIHRKREREFRSSLGSFAKNSYLEKLVDDLPEVNLTALANAEPIVQSAKEQTYILDEMLRTKRKGIANSSAQFFLDEEEETTEKQTKTIKDDPQSSDSVRSLIPEDPCTSGCQQDDDNELGKYLITEHSRQQILNSQQTEMSKNQLKNRGRPASTTSLSNNSELLGKDSSSRGDDELSAMGVDEVLVEGEVFLDSGEIIQLQIELCIKEDGERIHRLFQVFTGHSTGQPLIRYLLITDYYIYLLAGAGLPIEEELEENSKSEDAEELAAEAFEKNLMRMHNGPPKKFRILIVLPLCDIDHLAVGPDAQVLCFQSKRKKFRIHPQSGHEQRTFLVETCSRILGKTVAFAIQKTVANRALAASSSNSGVADDNSQQTITPLSITTSHSSQLGIVIKRFLRRELGIQKPEIVHHSLVYWQQNSPRQQKKQLDSASALECYLNVREHYQRGWTGRKGIGEWQQYYVVLRGLMMYQFADSSFKFAQRSLNLRDSVEEVCQIDTKSDEKYTFRLMFSKDVGGEGLSALEFSCPSEGVMNQWISALSLALSLSNEAPLPVACMAILTEESNMLFAQEGMNCFVDGFMRSLCSFHIHESAEIFAFRTDLNNVLLIRRDNGLDEWLIFRERLELERMVVCLRQRWQLPIIDFGENAEQLLKPEFNQLFMECARMPDLWKTEPKNSFD